MATRNQAAQKLADLILELVIKNDAIDSTTVESYRRVINIATGTPSVVDANGLNLQNILLYGEDYRQSGFAPEFYEKVDTVVDLCLADVNEVGGYRIPTIEGLAFNQGVENDTAFQGSSPYSENAWIEFSPPASGGDSNPNIMYPIQPLCTIANAGTNVSALILTIDVLGFLSQFIPFDNITRNINTDLANEVLDTNIYELIPGRLTRQERIDKLFTEFTDLIGPSPTEENTGAGFDLDIDQDFVTDTWSDLLAGQTNWHNLYGINPNVDPNKGNIVRLEKDTIQGKEGQSLETMRNIIGDYLKDLDYSFSGVVEDSRPDREVQGEGYLQLRHLNQSIIIRNEEDKELGIVGADEYNPDWLTQGFTISMWVRFLTQTGGGTLFNFGNPTRKNNPYGFKLETFTVSKTDYLVDGVFDSEGLPSNTFENSDYARFVRLVMFDPSGETLLTDENGNPIENVQKGIQRDSHFGTSLRPRLNSFEYGLAYEYDNKYAFNYTPIPNNFNEWFYIVATFDPLIMEDESYGGCIDSDSGVTYNNNTCPSNLLNLDYDKWFWLNHVKVDDRLNDIPGEGVATEYGKVYVGKTFMGNKCKVEVISKSEMNRGLGFKN